MKDYIHLHCINTQLQTTSPFSLLSPSPQVSLPWWYYVWTCIYIYTALTHTKQTTLPFSLFMPFSRLSLLCWYYKNTVLWFVWYCLVYIQLNFKFISIYPASTHSDNQQHHLTSLTSYHLLTAKLQDCIRGQPTVLRVILTLI